MSILSNSVKALILGFSVLLIGLLIVLSYYNCPAIFDEYCYACTAGEYGFWTAQKMYYNGWTGRYFSNFLFHLDPLFFSDNRTAYILIPILLFLGFAVNSYYLFSRFLKELLSKTELFFLTLSFVCLHYFTLPSIVENNFWMIGTYTFISGNMIMLLINMLYMYETKTKSNLLLAAILVLYFLILGSSEVSMFCTSTAILSFVGLNFLKHRKISKEGVLFIIITLLGNYLVITAPGNHIRSSVKKEIFSVLLQNINYSEITLMEWIVTPLFLVSTIAFLFFLSKFKISRNFVKMPVIFSVGIFLSILYVAFLPTTYGMGEKPPLRILNLIYMIFLLGWFYHLTILSIHLDLSHNLTIVASICLLSLALFFTYKSKNLREMYGDIRSQKAALYLEEYNARIKLLTDPSLEKVYLKPYVNQPISLYIGDITENPKHLWNKCLADYYHKKEVYLEHINQ